MTSPNPSRALTTAAPWPARIGALVLVVGSAWSAPLVDLWDLTVTGDRVLGLAAVAVVGVLLVRRRIRWSAAHTALAAFVMVQIVTSAVNARTWPEGPKFVAIYVLGFACFALAVECARGPAAQRWMTSVWIGVAIVLSATGAVTGDLSNWYQTAFWGAGPAQPLFQFTPHERALFGAKVTFNEWNLFSSFLLIPFTLVLWTWGRETASSPGTVAVLTAIVFGLVAGVTRAAWLSMLGLAVLWWRLRHPRRRQVIGLAAMVAAAFLAQAAAVGVLPLWTGLRARLFEQPTNIEHRLIINRATFESWLDRGGPAHTVATTARNVVIGHGAGSVNRLSLTFPGGGRMPRVWTGNAVLFVLHDSGVLGLGALLVVLAVIARRAASVIRRGPGPPPASLVVPLVASGVALAFAYQFTHGLWLMYPYVFAGLLTAVLETAEPS